MFDTALFALSAVLLALVTFFASLVKCYRASAWPIQRHAEREAMRRLMHEILREHDDWEISHFRRSQEDMHRLRTMTDELLRGVNHTLRDIFFLHCWCCAAEHVPQSLVNSSTQGNGPSSPASTVSVNYADLDDQPDQLDEE